MIKINGTIFGEHVFPNKEVRFLSAELNKDTDYITMFFEGNHDITNLMFANEYIDFNSSAKQKILLMPYIPYSRMDREINEQIFSLSYFASIINKMRFDRVIVFDAHSEKSLSLINNVMEINLEDIIIEEVLNKNMIDVIMFPDNGSHVKYSEKYPTINKKYPVIIGDKKRDLKTGKIKEYSIVNNSKVDLKNKKVLIVDDICSYGNTFIFASESLSTYDVASVDLFITHVENAIFESSILENPKISNIYTTNTILRKNKHPKIKEINIVKENSR